MSLPFRAERQLGAIGKVGILARNPSVRHTLRPTRSPIDPKDATRMLACCSHATSRKSPGHLDWQRIFGTTAPLQLRRA